MEARRWLPSAELTGSGRPVFLQGEVECALISAVDLEPEEDPTGTSTLRSGLLILTTHRLIWIGGSEGSAIPLGSVVHAFPPTKRSIRSMFSSPRIRIQCSVSGDGKVVDGQGGPLKSTSVVTIVMRGKGDDPDEFFARLWEVMKGRAWVATAGDVRRSVEGNAGTAGTAEAVRMPVVGVSGILRKEQEMWENTDKSLHDAFQDLNALMSKAKEMVMLAEKMRSKLLSGSTTQGSAGNDEEMGSKDMQEWLLSVGIASPVTKESAGALYHQQLSRQLADFVEVPLKKAGGMIALIDAYCLFNRARGTELISPEDMLRSCSIWEKFDVPVMLRKFDSGVMVIQNKTHSDEEVFSRIKSMASKPNALRTGISPSDAAMTLGIAPALAKEHLLTAESKGLLCRDISPEGFRFYVNVFPDLDPSNIFMIKPHSLFSVWVSTAAAAAASG
ncbi:Vacuolar protein sorting-associated protein 36 [Acorus calamus]|uniref:Vacuolar protein-sorting-associated protein 36 n=1 Tax=Acorus calamus TaxID=4465 RepID=A0AAV9EP77_ACOCL|nr:Vacuolar protein sorting-associated protein 36 [Acorus calamus]